MSTDLFEGSGLRLDSVGFRAPAQSARVGARSFNPDGGGVCLCRAHRIL